MEIIVTHEVTNNESCSSANDLKFEIIIKHCIELKEKSCPYSCELFVNFIHIRPNWWKFTYSLTTRFAVDGSWFESSGKTILVFFVFVFSLFCAVIYILFECVLLW